MFAHAVFWPEAASVSNPLGVTRAYAGHFTARGGIILSGDARSLHRTEAVGVSKLMKARLTQRNAWWRSARGRQTCSQRSV